MADAVVFAENTMDYNYEGYKERVLQIQKTGKKIYANAKLFKKINVDINSENIHLLKEKTFLLDLKENINIKEIDVPIISVMGMGENCDKFNLQVKIKKIIEKQGYNVLSICSNVLGKFLGMEILPGFLFSKNISYPEKIKNFNFWIYQLQKQRKPDIILLGCPGGISEFEAYETNFYGEIPLVIANSVSIDSGFVTLYANMEQTVDTVKKLFDFFMIKYNAEVKNYIFSRQFFKIDYEWRKIRYYKINEVDIPPFSVSNISDYHFSYIENNLEIEKQIKIMLTQLQNNFLVI